MEVAHVAATNPHEHKEGNGQHWQVTQYISTDLRYNSEVLVVNLSISICRCFILFTPLHLFDDISY